MRIQLGTKDGVDHWAEVLPPDEMTARQRKRVKETIKLESSPDGGYRAVVDGSLMEDMEAALIAAVTSSWSFPQPVNEDTVLDLPAVMFDLLVKATEPHFALSNFRRAETPGENSSD